MSNNTYEQRAVNEQEFVYSFLTACAKNNVVQSDVLSLCPVEMLAHGSKPWAVYRAAHMLDSQGMRITVPDIYALIVASKRGGDSSWPEITAAEIAEMCTAIYAFEDEVMRRAEIVRREGIKRNMEPVLVGMTTDCQQYGNNPADLMERVETLREMAEGGSGEQGQSFDDLLLEVYHSLESGIAQKPLPTPWDNLNRVLKGGMVAGELVVLAGRPGLGKTAFAGCIAVETARSGVPVLFVSREVRAQSLTARMIAREGCLDARMFRQGVESAKCQLLDVREAVNALMTLPLRIVEKSTVPMTPREIRRIAKSMRQKPGLIVVDYLQLVNPDNRTNSREREVAEMSRAFKQLALDMPCPVLLLSQLNRSVEESDRSPRLSDLRESGAIEQDADIVIFLHTKRSNLGMVQTPVQVEVAKGRSSGVGTAYAIFDKPHQNFVEDKHVEAWANTRMGSGNGL